VYASQLKAQPGPSEEEDGPSRHLACVQSQDFSFISMKKKRKGVTLKRLLLSSPIITKFVGADYPGDGP
jgi:hypothetical protein